MGPITGVHVLKATQNPMLLPEIDFSVHHLVTKSLNCLSYPDSWVNWSLLKVFVINLFLYILFD